MKINFYSDQKVNSYKLFVERKIAVARGEGERGLMLNRYVHDECLHAATTHGGRRSKVKLENHAYHQLWHL